MLVRVACLLAAVLLLAACSSEDEPPPRKPARLPDAGRPRCADRSTDCCPNGGSDAVPDAERDRGRDAWPRPPPPRGHRTPSSSNW